MEPPLCESLLESKGIAFSCKFLIVLTNSWPQWSSKRCNGYLSACKSFENSLFFLVQAHPQKIGSINLNRNGVTHMTPDHRRLIEKISQRHVFACLHSNSIISTKLSRISTRVWNLFKFQSFKLKPTYRRQVFIEFQGALDNSYCFGLEPKRSVYCVIDTFVALHKCLTFL